MTVSTAGSVVAVPEPLVNTASYSSPLSDNVVSEMVNEPDVAPGTGEKARPSSVETFHCTVGSGYPLAAAVNVTFCVGATVWLTGWVVTLGVTSGVPTMA